MNVNWCEALEYVVCELGKNVSISSNPKCYIEGGYLISTTNAN
jgi:hypothetical protein